MQDLESIKIIRSRLNIGLREAKQLFDEFQDVKIAIEYWEENKRKEELAMNNRKYASGLGWFFNDEYCQNLTEIDRFKIKRFAPSYCHQLWEKYVSTEHRHLMLVNSDEGWNITDLKREKYNWSDDWELENRTSFATNLSELVDWKKNDPVYFFYGRYAGYETTFEIFLNYWVSFFYDDERNILVNPNSSSVVIFTVHGSVETGKRKSIQPEK